MRRWAAENTSTNGAFCMRALEAGLGRIWNGSRWGLLLIVLLASAPLVMAEPMESRAPADREPVPASADLSLEAPGFEDAISVIPVIPVVVVVAASPGEGEPLVDERGQLGLEELLIVRTGDLRGFRPKTTDEVLAVAVARGPTPELEPKKPFRKRSIDLFRTERRVEIGNSEMLVRLRLRAKIRKAMSVELRF